MSKFHRKHAGSRRRKKNPSRRLAVMLCAVVALVSACVTTAMVFNGARDRSSALVAIDSLYPERSTALASGAKRYSQREFTLADSASHQAEEAFAQKNYQQAEAFALGARKYYRSATSAAKERLSTKAALEVRNLLEERRNARILTSAQSASVTRELAAANAFHAARDFSKSIALYEALQDNLQAELADIKTEQIRDDLRQLMPSALALGVADEQPRIYERILQQRSAGREAWDQHRVAAAEQHFTFARDQLATFMLGKISSSNPVVSNPLGIDIEAFTTWQATRVVHDATGHPEVRKLDEFVSGERLMMDASADLLLNRTELAIERFALAQTAFSDAATRWAAHRVRNKVLWAQSQAQYKKHGTGQDARVAAALKNAERGRLFFEGENFEAAVAHYRQALLQYRALQNPDG